MLYSILFSAFHLGVFLRLNISKGLIPCKFCLGCAQALSPLVKKDNLSNTDKHTFVMGEGVETVELYSTLTFSLGNLLL